MFLRMQKNELTQIEMCEDLYEKRDLILTLISNQTRKTSVFIEHLNNMLRHVDEQIIESKNEEPMFECEPW
ncbi:hypothetical protein [Fluoribacter gormanii]|uniref:hypothetical protein n=1 Tax=Fluoribacter gormanii TaxID=464 RepID=UPI0010415F15|nr:hypothetical protein [Fluoribacter gormanii]